MSTIKIKLKDEAVADLGPEDADVPVAEDEIKVVVIVGQRVGLVKPSHIIYDWF
jgi:hypothetical protein